MITDNWVYWRFKNENEPLGEFGEQLWSSVIRACGFRYIQLSSLPPLRGKGPRLQGTDEILPDFVVTAGVECQQIYMDSKCKTRPVEYGHAQELRHGIDYKDYEHYEAIAGIHRQKCLLGIVELFGENRRDWSGTLLVNSLGRLGNYSRGFSTQAHMVYWPRDRFQNVGSYTPSELWGVAKGTTPPTEQTVEMITNAFVIEREHVQARLW